MASVAVLLPVYNAERYLDIALQSILGQSYSDFTLCIIDDGSTDSSRKIVLDYAAQDSRILFRSRENRGLVSTLNELAAMTASEYLIRMDADDICETRRCEELVRFMEANPDCVACGSEVLLIDPFGRPIRKMGSLQTHDNIDAAHLAGAGGAIIHPASIIRTSVFTAIGGYCEDYMHAEDLDLFLRLAEQGRLANLPLTLLQYRQHFNSVGYAHRVLQRNSTYKALQHAYMRRNIRRTVDYNPEDAHPITKRVVFLKWAWWALSSGYRSTARHYALKALAKNVCSFDSWKLFICVIRGY
ncbi:glycosyltransferase family A protein [uncultured Microbulbifer sp.]|uniref:glycosyltransferase family 2 protein n=1 Tax=uncultured Microbulbifer sp. TaxID=348147 RepID=UPI002611BAE8|nr:glycosyltransferase family A protein [uncultured Microbulbifer sp.]